jgi:hypothetical protein
MKLSGETLKAVEILRQAGISNVRRLVALVEKTIAFLGLDLSGLTVLTEAASGPYVVTPVIAGLAGAECVLALTGESKYATADEVINQTRALEVLCGIEGSTEIHTRRSLKLFEHADIVTNLGFVRPIDRAAVAAMKPNAVVPLMCEAWEFRQGDVDMDACHSKGIAVLGTNEDYPGLKVFDYSGWLCLKMLFDAQIEVHKSEILVVGSDKFSSVIKGHLKRCGVSVRWTSTLNDVEVVEDVDAIVVADYSREDMIIGPEGDLAAADLAAMASGLTVIQFAGRVDVPSLTESGITVYPGIELESGRMARTLAELGVRPVVELHAGGLKVGQVLAQARQSKGLSVAESIEYALTHSPGQAIIDQLGEHNE